MCRDVFEGRRLGVDLGQGESENAAAAETVRDQRAKRWELMHVHGRRCGGKVGDSEKDEKVSILRRSVTDRWIRSQLGWWPAMKMARQRMYLLWSCEKDCGIE